MFPLVGSLSVPRRVAIVARWPYGIARATWEYFTRSVPIHRTETEGDRSDLPDPVPAAQRDDRLQDVQHGVGALLHRRYTVTVDGADVDPVELITTFANEPNRAVPSIATFAKTRGRPATTVVGDEFSIRMPGPWNGPVRVVAVEPGLMRLATLSGHLEAGQIEFRARRDGEALVLEIESRARPGDLLSCVLYNAIGLAKEVQLTLWVETLLHLTQRSGGRIRDGVHVDTRRLPAALVNAG